MKSIVKALKTCFLIVGSVIGAGFVSGREIISFFYGQDSIFVGLALFVCFFTGLSFLLCSRTVENNFILKLFKPFLLLANLVFAGGMLAAIDSLFCQFLSLPEGYPIFSLLSIVLSNVILYKGIGAVKTVNAFLVPFMIAMIVIVCFTQGEFYFVRTGEFSPLSVLSYFGLNVFMSILVFNGAGKRQTTANNIFAAVLSAFILSLLVAVMLSVFSSSNREIITFTMPILCLTNNPFTYYPLIACMAFGIFTTLLSSHYPLFCVVENGRFTFFNRIFLSFIIIVVSRLGFYNIVSFVYPAIGVVGGVIVVLIAISTIFFRRKKPKDTSAPPKDIV